MARDPVTLTDNPKAIPLAFVEYLIRATNPNPASLTVDNVIIADSLPADVRLFFGLPTDPLTFVQGSPSSSLSYSFGGLADLTDDIRFSNDGGVTFVVPSVDANGLDATIPRINYIEITPQGTFAADTGGGTPSFELTYEVRLD